MFGMSFGELVIIMVVALIVFGPERLPHIASQMGKIAADLRKTSDSFRREFYNSVYIPSDEFKTIERDLSRLVTTEKKHEPAPPAPDKPKEQ